MGARRPLSPEQRAYILAGVEAGRPIPSILRTLGVRPPRLYLDRRYDPAFEAAFMAAARRAPARQGRGIMPIGSAGGRRADEEKVRADVLGALRAGSTFLAAVRAAGCSDGMVYRMRRDDPEFDRAVVDAALAGRQAGCLPRPMRATDAPGACTVPDCRAEKTKARGLCARHYHQWYRTGKAGPAEQTYGRKECVVPGCGRPHRARGYCTRCYERHVRPRRSAATAP